MKSPLHRSDLQGIQKRTEKVEAQNSLQSNKLSFANESQFLLVSQSSMDEVCSLFSSYVDVKVRRRLKQSGSEDSHVDIDRLFDCQFLDLILEQLPWQSCRSWLIAVC